MDARQREAVLRIARGAIEHELGVRPEAPACDVELPASFGGAFVTLKRAGRLRGCMGTFTPLGTLAQTIDHVARTSCRDDPRFARDRITAGELGKIDIEVSVLSESWLTEDPASLVVGEHGILIRRGSFSGCLLPQVATERGWDAEEFLSQCCAGKAGLSRDAWKDPETKTYLFSAEIISEPPPPSGPAAG